MKISILATLGIRRAASDRARRIRVRAAFIYLSVGVGPVAHAADISTCQTIGTNGNYTVTQDLKVTTITTNSPNCLIIGHSNVGIDLGGHTITGLGDGRGVGITDTSEIGGGSFSTIIIAKGKIRGFGTGILLGTDITISQMDVSQNTGNGISIGEGAVTNTRSDQNGGNGISLTGAVSDSEASQNGGNGITLGDNSHVNNTSTNNNYGNGMYFVGNSGSVSNSESNGNGGYGMYFYGNFYAVLDSQANNNNVDGCISIVVDHSRL